MADQVDNQSSKSTNADDGTKFISVIRMQLTLGPHGNTHDAWVQVDASPAIRSHRVMRKNEILVEIDVQERFRDAPVILGITRQNAFILARQLLRQCKLIDPIDKVIANLDPKECLYNQ